MLMNTVHIQRPIDSDLYAGLLEYINLLDTQFNFRGKSMIEIGSYQGESTEQFAKLFGSIHAIDPWQNGYDPNDISSHVTDMALVEQAFDNRMIQYPNVKKIKGKAEVVIPTFNSIVDFVYIDGIHTREALLQDLHNASKISKYIGGHDWGWTDVLESIKEFLKVESLEGQPIYVCRDSSWIINKQFV